MKRFDITFAASKAGKRFHCVKANNKKAAIDRIAKAYPGQKITVLQMVNLNRNLGPWKINHTGTP